MDIARPSKPGTLKVNPKWLIAVLVLLAVVGSIYASTNITTRSFSRSGLQFAEVRQGNMQVRVFGNGTLVPREVRWVATSVEGRVNRILVKPGRQVAKGELLLELDNPELVQAAEEKRWELAAEEAELVALEVSLETELLNQRTRIKTVDIDLQGVRLQFDAERKLVESGLATISMLEHRKSELRVRQLENELEAEKLRLDRIDKNRQAQLQARRARINKLANNLERAQQRVTALQVTALEPGIVQEVAATLGERLATGANLVKVADQTRLIAELKVAERMINEVTIGQPVRIDTRKSRIDGVVARIDPAVINGSVLVEVGLPGELPPEARPDLSVSGDILVADIQDTLYVERPVLAQSNQPGVIYRLDRSEASAEKTPVRFGTGSSDQIQILTGLTPGDKIILSDHTSWEHLQRIGLK